MFWDSELSLDPSLEDDRVASDFGGRVADIYGNFSHLPSCIHGLSMSGEPINNSILLWAHAMPTW